MWHLVFNFLCLFEFTETFTYVFRLMRVCVGFIMLAAYFVIPAISNVEYNCALINAECIALRVVGAVSQWEARADTLQNVPNPTDQ